MTLAEAIAEIEAQFIVHHEIGAPTEYNDTTGKWVADGPRDWSCAPCGDKYLTVTSGGVKDQGAPMSAYFSSEGRATTWWVYSVEDYAETIAPKDQWSKLHLYWRDQPEYSEAEYVAMGQAELVRGSKPHPLHVTLGSIFSRLVISKLNPDGKED